MEHYKSWGTQKKWLEGNLCQELSGRVTFFLTRYHKVHDAYGRAAIRVDGAERAIFSWIEMCHQETGLNELWRREGKPPYDMEGLRETLKPEWDGNCTWCELDFLSAALKFRSMPIQDALASDDYIIKVLAIMDRRVGTRTLQRIAEDGAYLQYPDWVKQFYLLRLP